MNLGFIIWVFSSFVLFGVSLLILSFSKEKRTILLSVGFLSLILDYVFETMGIMQGGWRYDQSLLFIGLVPIELMLLFFSVGVLSVYLISKFSSGIPKDSRGIVEILLLFIGAVLFVLFLFGVTPVTMIHVVIPLGIWGVIVSNRKQAVLLVATIVFIFDLVTELLFTTTDIYWYRDGFDITIPLIYFFITMFLGGIITNEKWCKEGSSVCVVGARDGR